MLLRSINSQRNISAETKPIQNRPFIVFHDAYQYFETRFGLTAVGSISDVSAAAPSAKRLKEIKDKLEETKAICVFREPQFDAKYVTVVLEGSKAKQGVLDPIGSDIDAGAKGLCRIAHQPCKICQGLPYELGAGLTTKTVSLPRERLQRRTVLGTCRSG